MGTATKQQTAASNVAGATAGTGLLGLANLIPDEHANLKAIAIYASPAISVCISYGWIVASLYFRKTVNSLSMNNALKEARKVRDEVCGNPSSSTQHKTDVQSMVEGLEKLKMQIINDGAVQVTAKLKEIE